MIKDDKSSNYKKDTAIFSKNENIEKDKKFLKAFNLNENKNLNNINNFDKNHYELNRKCIKKD